MVEIKQLEMVILFVSDVNASVTWYQTVLGLTVVAQHGDFASLQAGDSRVALHGGLEQPAGAREQTTMPVFAVADYEAAKQQLEALGCHFYFENSTPAAQFGSFLDPDGNPLQIMQTV